MSRPEQEEARGMRTEIFYGRTVAELATLQTWAESMKLPCSAKALPEPVPFRDGLFHHVLKIGPIRIADSATFDALDNAEETFGFTPSAEGSFRDKVMEERADETRGRFSTRNAA